MTDDFLKATVLHYRAAYTETMLRKAVRLFVWRGVVCRRGWLGLLAMAALGVSLAKGWKEDPSWVSAIEIAAISLPPLLYLFVWRAHIVKTVGKFRSMTRPAADFVLRDADVTITSEFGSTTLRWSRFVDMWETPEFFMLFLARDQFLTLPAATMQEDIRTFLRSRLAMIK